MEILKTILSNADLADKVYHICDIEIYSDMKAPYDTHSQRKWNIDGMAFGCDGTGGEFVLLADGTVGYNGTEGKTGRIAENLTDLFSLLINVPCFSNFLMPELYQDDVLLKGFVHALETEYKNDFNEIAQGEYAWDITKAEIAYILNISLDNNIAENTLRKFYCTATREPQYQYVFEGTDGEKRVSECIISRPMQPWVKETAGME
jgi:hypothetical protein